MIDLSNLTIGVRVDKSNASTDTSGYVQPYHSGKSQNFSTGNDDRKNREENKQQASSVNHTESQ